MSQNIRNSPAHHETIRSQEETPQQMVNRIVQQVLEQLKNMPEVVNIVRLVLEKLQSIEKNLDGPLTRAYLEQLTVHNRVY
jgi:vacuolar-type H+-ATPase subunit E/Vma4